MNLSAKATAILKRMIPTMNKTECQRIKCKDYLTDDGEPAWCFRAGCPAVVAAGKCPKITGQSEKEKKDDDK